MVANPGSARIARTARRLNEPRPATVVPRQGSPALIDRSPVAIVREEWHVVDRWWTEQPIQRRYFDVVLTTGENVVVFVDELSERWFRQRA